MSEPVSQVPIYGRMSLKRIAEQVTDHAPMEEVFGFVQYIDARLAHMEFSVALAEWLIETLSHDGIRWDGEAFVDDEGNPVDRVP